MRLETLLDTPFHEPRIVVPVRCPVMTSAAKPAAQPQIREKQRPSSLDIGARNSEHETVSIHEPGIGYEREYDFMADQDRTQCRDGSPTPAPGAPGGISRRGFLKGVGGTVITTAAIGGAAAAPATSATQTGAPKTLKGIVKIELDVNGARRTVEVEPRTTLLSALRDRMQVTGPKEVCNVGTCGACTVLVDGKSQLSCLTLAVDARDRAITTVEGLLQGDDLGPVQAAFVEKDALMCGFCTPGFVMSAEALLRENPKPTPDEIRAGVSGNLCRCGTYPKIFEAIDDAARQRKGK